jgi:hypothetical protein
VGDIYALKNYFCSLPGNINAMMITMKYRCAGLYIFFASLFLCLQPGAHAQHAGKISVSYSIDTVWQTIHNFSASDAWACQFAGNWPDEKRNRIADWLFSMDTLADGSPQGIGLSMWRYNIGAGTAEQGDSSGIKDEWRRAASLDSKAKEAMDRIRSQNWFLKAAKERGVKQFLGFFNSPPVQLTINGKGYASKGKCNISSSNYKAFARYTVKAIKQIKQSTGIGFNYISPVNEPQWDWSDGGQEGCPYNNTEISGLVKSLNAEFLKNNISSKIVVPEAGNHKYLLKGSDKPGKDNQVADFFDPLSSNYIGDLPAVAKVIASHSYFTTSPASAAVALRKQIKEHIAGVKNIEYWQSEYCILGDNEGEINGSRRDLGMNAALYVAKVIYHDLVAANASAWQWWLAVSPYNYKDGLIYIDKDKANGSLYDSKMLWAMGNYSRFIRPGMQRIEVGASSQEVCVSGFKDPDNGMLVLIFVNTSSDQQPIAFNSQELPVGKGLATYTTGKTTNLQKSIVMMDQLVIPAESVVTVIINK